MSRRILFLPFAALVVFAGYLGLQLGQPVSETDILNTYADRYLTLAPAGAQVTDCIGTPGQQDAVRLTVTCTHPNGTRFDFPVGPRGRLIGQGDTGPEA